jgi:hypothetical protein
VPGEVGQSTGARCCLTDLLYTASARTLAFDLLKQNQFPVRVLRIGRRAVVPVPDLLHLLGSDASPER